jgi:hypothetical protein
LLRATKRTPCFSSRRARSKSSLYRRRKEAVVLYEEQSAALAIGAIDPCLYGRGGFPSRLADTV